MKDVKIPNDQVLKGKAHRDSRTYVRCSGYNQHGQQCILETGHHELHKFGPYVIAEVKLPPQAWPFPTGGFAGGEG